MHYGWSLRETESMLKEDRELASALALREAPDHTTLYRFAQRLPPGELDRALNTARAYAHLESSPDGGLPANDPQRISRNLLYW
jgi:hypothetical protein